MTGAQLLEVLRADPKAARVLDRPTLGAWRRANGVTGMCEEARIALAWEMVSEAWRLILMDRLDALLAGKITDPRHMARRLRWTADLIDPPQPAQPAETEAA